ncbi:MAG: hypothetical protein K1X67_24560 [Fimbriimonadaceae bacterium]|nr:hypothetical protein [Fimbriimonadaceae bacterium]
MSQGNDLFDEHMEARETAMSELEVDLQAFSSVALARLTEEVKNEDLPSVSRYDRTYNRHNR